jgi:hypothetical protein
LERVETGNGLEVDVLRMPMSMFVEQNVRITPFLFMVNRPKRKIPWIWLHTLSHSHTTLIPMGHPMGEIPVAVLPLLAMYMTKKHGERMHSR